MMEFKRAFLYAINNFDEQAFQQLLQRWREEPRDPTISADDNALDGDVARVLREHGCSVENHAEFQRVVFPQGTTCDVLIRVMSSHYLLTLPSGLKVKQIEKVNRNFSLLFIVEGQNDDAPKPDSTSTRDTH